MYAGKALNSMLNILQPIVLFKKFYFIIFAFTYMCKLYLGHTPHLQAEPVPPSCSPIYFVEGKHKRQ
jgi:hypothetical protein